MTLRLLWVLVLLCAAHAVRASPLRLIAETGTQSFSEFAVVDEKVVLRGPAGTQPLPRGTKWRLEGDVRSNYENLRFSPSYGIVLDRGRKENGRFGRYAAVVHFKYDDLFPEKEIGNAIVVVLWLVEGQVTQVATAATPARRKLGGGSAAIVPLSLGAKRQGAPAVLVLKDGVWLKPKPSFKDGALNVALAEMHLGTIEDFERAIDGARSIDGRSSSNVTLLQIAAESGLPLALEALRRRNARWKSGHREWGGPLHAAAVNGRLETVQWLLANGASGDSRSDKRSPFDLATASLHFDVAELFVGEKWNDRALTLLKWAVKHDDERLAERLLSKRGPKVSRKDGELLMTGSVARRNPELVRLMLRLGVAADGSFEGKPFLVHAAELGDAACVDILLAAGASVEGTGKRGESAVEAAARAGANDVIRRLVAAGAKVPATPIVAGAPADNPSARYAHLPIWDSWAVDVPPEVKTAVVVEAERRRDYRPQADHGTDYVNVWGSHGLELRAVPVVRVRSDVVEGPPDSPSWAALSFVVEPDGRASGAQALGMSSQTFWKTVEEALRKFEFQPGTVAGEPVRTHMVLAIVPRS